MVYHGEGILVEIRLTLVDAEHAVGHLLQRVALDVLEDGAVAVVDVHHVEIQPVGHLVVGMARGVGEVNLVLAVAVILGVGTCARRLHDLLRSEVHRHIVVGVGHGDARHGGVPVDAAPAEVDVVRVVAEDEGRRIGGVVLCRDEFLLTELRDVARLHRHAIPDLRLVGMAGVENHDTLVGQHDERGVVVVVGLEHRAYQHLRATVVAEIYLRSLHIAMNIDVTDVAGVDGATCVLVVDGARVGKPAPGALVGHGVRCHRRYYGRHRHDQ